ncbi:MAG: beta-Ala-His dipeptidase [Ignavibacteriales bacterium]|nr:beta-Ala-His dipeptidase [Ignavibacteriales bacterium]
MGNILGGLKPKLVWDIFEEMCKYPRPSKHEEKVVDYVMKWADEHKFATVRDKAGNIVVKVPATPGLEKKATVVLQGHLDMVPEKNKETQFDFLKDEIRPLIDGEWVTADGTTLGADNGIGVAAGMAVALDESVEHGPLELLMTLDEETGLTGAQGLESGMLEGKTLLNLDSEEDGALFIGCSGGLDTRGKRSVQLEDVADGALGYEIIVKGLKGGHSGLEIQKQRGNAIKILGRLLWNLTKDYEVELCDLEGGNKRNAIPRESSAVVAVSPNHETALKKYVEDYDKIVKAELSSVDPNVAIEAKKIDAPGKRFDKASRDAALDLIQAIPHGVIRMSDDMEDMVQTSTNLATIKFEEGAVHVGTSQRSSVDSEIKALGDQVISCLRLAGFEVDQGDGYPGWKPNVDSEIKNIVATAHADLFDKEPEVTAIHAGLECGIIKERYPAMDMISFGPTIEGPHSPDERVNIETVERFYKLLVETLKRIPDAK